MTLPIKLSRREHEIMEIVFALGKSTLTDIQNRMENPPTRAALRSILTILETKGHLAHGKEGREFTYHATLAREGVGRSALRRVLDVFFDGSLKDAVSAHFSNPAEKITGREIAELEALLDAARSKQSRSPSSKTSASRQKEL